MPCSRRWRALPAEFWGACPPRAGKRSACLLRQGRAFRAGDGFFQGGFPPFFFLRSVPAWGGRACPPCAMERDSAGFAGRRDAERAAPTLRQAFSCRPALGEGRTAFWGRERRRGAFSPGPGKGGPGSCMAQKRRNPGRTGRFFQKSCLSPLDGEQNGITYCL